MYNHHVNATQLDWRELDPKAFTYPQIKISDVNTVASFQRAVPTRIRASLVPGVDRRP